MAKKMLIDATHLEETRVVVVDGNKVDDFDFESVAKRQLSGNIYLAKVTRVEPSLQAAFVDYGGNRHGFLAFAEIHPDYYQIPVADREALIAEEAAEQERTAAGEARREAAAEKDQKGKDQKAQEKAKEKPRRSRRKKGAEAAGDETADTAAEDSGAAEAKGSDEPAAEEADGGRKDRRSRRGRKADKHKSSGLEVIDFDEDGGDDAGAGDDRGGVRGLEVADLSEDEGSGEGSEGNESGSGGEGSPPKSMAEKTGLDEAETVSEDVESGDDSGRESKGKPSGKGRGRRRGRQSRREASSQDDGNGQNGNGGNDSANGGQSADTIESIEPDEPQQDAARARAQLRRRYRIQDVVKVRQIMLVQVVKEERGNKGAALTTYLSLPGRYCVLMPNTARGGGISRKITNAADRKRLRQAVDEMDVASGMGLIVRTAGAERTKAEIKRDFEFLLRQWEQIRELTLNSIAPTLIYEEGSLIKRSIRDLYSKDIDAILVEGEAGYREAKDYMKMLMPSHARHVQQYTDRIPLFIRYQVESYLSGMFNPVVQLRSGGYIVIGQTEALVAIDVNSGRSTRESSVEETATKTNLEAAEEIARQLRLRDLAGLIVIDFIDMDERRNNAAVEKRFKEKLKVDRARLQVGRISPFGLLEMSRQRLRPGMVEISTQPCPHCHGQGVIRSDESLALSILREVEEEGVRGRAAEVQVSAPVDIANFIINAKRRHLTQIEERYGLVVAVEADPLLRSPEYRIEPSKTRSRQPETTTPVVTAESAVATTTVEAPQAEASPPSHERGDRGDKGEGRSRRRRGKRGGRRRRGGQDGEGQEARGEQRPEPRDEARAKEEPSGGQAESTAEAPAEHSAAAEQSEPRKADEPQRGRGRRGGRGRGKRSDDAAAEPETGEHPAAAEAPVAPVEEPPSAQASGEASPTEEPAPQGASDAEPAPAEQAETAPEAPEATVPAQARREDRGDAVSEAAPEAAPETAPEPSGGHEPAAPESEPRPEPKDDKSRPKRSGWWQWR